MLYFSYNDFIDCTENGEINKKINLEENTEIYKLIDTKQKVQEEKNQIIEILKNKIQMKKFLNEFLNIQDIGDINNLKYYNNIKEIKDENKTIIYKIENKEIFVFIRVINKIDYNISYKMFEDSLKIINKWNIYEKKENKRNPLVIPIVIYTGKETWKNNIYNTLNYITTKNNRINFSYNIININDINIDKLKNMKCKVAQELLKIKNKYLQITQQNIDL